MHRVLSAALHVGTVPLWRQTDPKCRIDAFIYLRADTRRGLAIVIGDTRICENIHHLGRRGPAGADEYNIRDVHNNIPLYQRLQCMSRSIMRQVFMMMYLHK